MPYFVVQALDKPGVLQTRLSNREAHRARLRDHAHPITVHVGGPLQDDEGSMIGSLLIIEAETKSAVAEFLAGDPYAIADLYDAVRIDPFAWGLGAPDDTVG